MVDNRKMAFLTSNAIYGVDLMIDPDTALAETFSIILG